APGLARLRVAAGGCAAPSCPLGALGGGELGLAPRPRFVVLFARSLSPERVPERRRSGVSPPTPARVFIFCRPKPVGSVFRTAPSGTGGEEVLVEPPTAGGTDLIPARTEVSVVRGGASDGPGPARV